MWREGRLFPSKSTFPASAPDLPRSKSIIFISTCHMETVYGKVHFPPRETSPLSRNFSSGPSPLFVRSSEAVFPDPAIYHATRNVFPFFLLVKRKEKRMEVEYGRKTRSRLQISIKKRCPSRKDKERETDLLVNLIV